MKLTHLLPPLTLLSILPSSLSWGTLGHQTVAYIASNFVVPETRTFFQTILHNKTTSYLAGVATWADSYRYTAAGRWSAPLHFIDAEDDPPKGCGVKYSRDCGEMGCSLGAILNFTNQLLDSEVSAANKLMAAKFVIHFVGDIHQPLHNEALDVGGNSILVTFGGIPVNLHALWDTNMPEKLVGGYSLADALTWANILTAAIQTGAYQYEAASWLTGMALADPITTSLSWAAEANAYVCSTVLPDGVTAVQGKELNGTYYESAVPVIQLQIARAGYRLAAWLDLIAQSGKTEL